jgi:hypothetical protein
VAFARRLADYPEPPDYALADLAANPGRSITPMPWMDSSWEEKL